MNKIDTLITKWQTKIDNLIVMDDYDGGAASVMSETLKDLKDLKQRELEKDEYGFPKGTARF